MTIYEKLIKIQNELKAPKNQYNSFGKYNYRSCEDILEALKPICMQNKAVTFISDDIINVDGRQYVKATVTLVDIEKGDKIEVSAMAREEENKKGMDGSQVTGASSSYARKYALNGMFCIDDTKDSDATNTHGKDNKPKSGLTEAQVKRLYAIGNKANQTPATILSVCIKEFGVKKVEELSKEQYDNICERLEKRGK